MQNEPPHVEPEHVEREQDPAPGRLVRTVGRLIPGVRTSGVQIAEYGKLWHHRNDLAMIGNNPLWVALGDSLAQGIGASEIDNGYIARLDASDDSLSVVNLSKSGAKIADVLIDQLPLVSLLPRPAVFVTCTVGSNDLLRGINVRATCRSMKLLIGTLPANAVMATVPEKGSVAAKSLNKVIRRECERRDLPVADVGRALDSWKGRFAADGMHPNDVGHQLWFETFEPFLGAQTGFVTANTETAAP